MLTVNKLIPQGRGLAKVLVGRAATIEADWDLRQKSRFDAQDSTGRRLGIFLPRGTTVRGGDVLVADDGTLVRVLAAPQPVMVVRADAERGTPFDLLRAAYHLGNRHVPLALAPGELKFEPDHVLAGMLQQMGLQVTEALAPFEPEAGAYGAGAHGVGGGHAHGHGHAHDHADHVCAGDHAHDAGHDHQHCHDPDHQHCHGHGHDHRHGHAHDHDH